MGILLDCVVDPVVIEERLLLEVEEFPLDLLEVGVLAGRGDDQVLLDLSEPLNILVL